MKETRKCSRCGAALSLDLGGFCPHCLLQVGLTPPGFLPPQQDLPAETASSSEVGGAERPGQRIGRFRLLRKVGEGGFGVVYQAEQQEPVRRVVALKVIKLG